MLTARVKRACAVTIMALWLAACGGGAELLIIPLFEFGFSGTSGAVQVSVFFFPDKPTQSSGTFDKVNVSLNGATPLIFTGTYSGCTFNLSTNEAVTAPLSNSLSGRFTSKDTIELVLSGGIGLPLLTVKRNDPGGVGPTPDFGC